jgi:predicted TIM-barrel fold metal-dependent hydrolase
MASVENGSDYLPDLVRKLRNTVKKMPGYFQEDPVQSLKQNWWINPFWEDDVYEIAEVMGTDRVLFGSDWPHIEGMPEPLDYVTELAKFDDAERKQILFDNVTALNTPQPL